MNLCPESQTIVKMIEVNYYIPVMFQIQFDKSKERW